MHLGRSQAEARTCVPKKTAGSWRSGRIGWIMLCEQDFVMIIDKPYVTTFMTWRKARLG